jgi:signal transduction histidine kinase
MLKRLIRGPALLSPDFASFRQQEAVFVGLDLVLLAVLLLAQFLWPRYLGQPHLQTLAILAVGILINLSELLWLRSRQDMSWANIARLTSAMIVIDMAIAFALASYSHRVDIQYFALMIPAIFRAAFRFPLGPLILIVFTGDGLILLWVWNYFRLYPPTDPNEYVEAGTISLIYAFTALLVWTLVDHLRRKQMELTMSLAELEKVEAKLLIEEKLAAVGRFSSAIAHEIRNPVAMISSALSTAESRGLSSPESQEMFVIATKEAARLERLTTDFLVYARPRLPEKILSDIADSIGYIAEICGPRAAERGIQIHCECQDGLWAEADSGQLQQALLNLAMNAVEASLPNSSVTLRGSRNKQRLHIDVENANGPIPEETVACIFEPFFTTKQRGTGLGLAISRNVALAHDGDLILSQNRAELIRFTMLLPLHATEERPAS